MDKKLALLDQIRQSRLCEIETLKEIEDQFLIAVRFITSHWNLSLRTLTQFYDFEANFTQIKREIEQKLKEIVSLESKLEK